MQGRETVINMPPAPRQKPKQKSAAGAPRQSLLGDLGWVLGTGAGNIYLAAILCLCAWPRVHFIVQLAQHTKMVSLTPYPEECSTAACQGLAYFQLNAVCLLHLSVPDMSDILRVLL